MEDSSSWFEKSMTTQPVENFLESEISEVLSCSSAEQVANELVGEFKENDRSTATLILESEESDVMIAAKTDKIQRRRVLYEKLKMSTSVLRLQPKHTTENEIDLATEEDKRDPEMDAFFEKIEKNFPKKRPERKSKSPKGQSLNGILRYNKLKDSLTASMSMKRREMQERRKQLYMADNEGLIDSENEEDIKDEETSEEKQWKRKEKRDLVLASLKENEEGSSNDDESYSGGHDENFESDEDSNMKSTEVDQEDETPTMHNSFMPSSLSQWFGEGPKAAESCVTSDVFMMDGLENTVSQAPSNSQDDELMMLCSGVFPPTQPRLDLPENSKETPFTRIESDDEDDGGQTTQLLSLRKKKRVIESDDEVENERDKKEEANESFFNQSNEMSNFELLDKEDTDNSDNPKNGDNGASRTKMRVVLDDSDDERERQEEKLIVKENMKEVDEEAGEVEQDDEDEVEDEIKEDEDEDEKKKEEIDLEEDSILSPLPSDHDDSDDEMAVYRRLEHRQMLKKKGFLDDQADLSGDDIGSEDEDNDNEEMDYYEAELGDADSIDLDEVRRENHKLMLKQQNDEDHKSIVRMQNELLKDGDLGGSETDRRFRFTIRQEVDEGTTGIGISEEGDHIDEEEEGDEQTAKDRINALKFKIQQDEGVLLEPDDSDALSCAFNMASNVVQSATCKLRSIPSLLGNEGVSLSTSAKESNVGGVKHMYIQKAPRDQQETLPKVGGANAFSSSGIKRPSTNQQQETKKPKMSVFSELS